MDALLIGYDEQKIRRDGSSVKQSKRLLDSLKNKVKKPINEAQLKMLASGVKSSDLKDEKRIRQLVQQLSVLANVQISEQKMNEIVQYIKTNNISSSNIGELLKIWNQKK